MMNIRPEISIGMPVYNGERYLRQAIDSLLSQSFADFELIISDNASADKTQEICEEYANRDARINYIRQPQNMGGPRNWNYVFTCSQGDYFKWASANDVCHPEFLDGCKRVLDERDDVVLCYPRTKFIDENGQVTEEYEDVLDIQDERAKDRFIRLLMTMRLNNAESGLIRAHALRKTALEGIHQGGDINLMADLILRGKFYELPEYYYYRRMSPDSVTVEKSKAEIRRFNNPDSYGKIDLSDVKFQFAFFKSVHHSSLPAGEKTELYKFLIKATYWNFR
ncbi:glycosyltransferase family 2 protein [candidate division KSB1 bacterium]|nr:glycosyltransferase family 2 protein [candidate division KSB1 bacterium]